MQLAIKQIQMMGDKVLVRPDTADEIRESGLFIPGHTKHYVSQGDVVAVGPGARNTKTGDVIPMNVKVGQRVCWTKHTGMELELQGETLKVLTPLEITCRMEPADAK